MLFEHKFNIFNFYRAKNSCCSYLTYKSVHGKNGFVEISENLARYRSENSFVEPSK